MKRGFTFQEEGVYILFRRRGYTIHEEGVYFHAEGAPLIVKRGYTLQEEGVYFSGGGGTFHEEGVYFQEEGVLLLRGGSLFRRRGYISGMNWNWPASCPELAT